MKDFLPDTDVIHFVEKEFGAVDLGDKRLNRRLLRVVGKLAHDPGWSIPHASGAWPETKATYRICSNKRVTREKVLEPHIEATVQRVGEEAEFLVAQDTTFLNYTAHPALKGIGTIGTRKQKNKLKGVLVHSSLALSVGDHRALGVLDQQVLVREENRPAGEDSRKRPKGKRESQKWLTGTRQVIERLGEPSAAIFVFDREGDIFEAVEEIQDGGARFVIRASHNRRIETASETRAYLLDEIRFAPIKARKTVRIPAGGGRKERTAELSLRAGTYRIMPPADRKRRGESRQVNLVWAVEENPPNGEDPIEWMLLTSEPIGTAKEVIAVLNHYCGRWKIEEWHKALKTGCRIEQRQLERWERLEVLLGIYSVIGWRLLLLRDAARHEDVCPKEALSETQRAILTRIDPSLKKTNDARAYVRAVAKLGGFLGRKRDGDPGWITLWRGYTRLRDMEIGYRLPHEDETGG